MEMKSYAQGAFSWADLQTTDINGAKKFYSGLFGWDLKDTPIPQGGSYTMFFHSGKSLCGAGEMQPDVKKSGAPAFWTSYVNVDDVDAMAKKVEKAGGKIMMPPMDVMEEGRMFVFSDPTGAALGCWQPKNHKGAGLYGEDNALCWFEMMTTDVPKAKAFFGEVFGWKLEEDTGGMQYDEIVVGDKHVGGIMPMPKELKGVPNNWTPYFAVADVDATVKKCTALGGAVRMPAQDVPNVGRFAVLADPQGGVFDVIHTKR